MNTSGQMIGTAQQVKPSGLAFATYIGGDGTGTFGVGTGRWINDLDDIVAVIDSRPTLICSDGTRVSLLHPAGDRTWTVTAPLMIDNRGRIIAVANRDTAAVYQSNSSYVLLTPITP